MNQKTLISWIGGNDLDAVDNNHQGPILRTLLSSQYAAVHLLYNYDDKQVQKYTIWLGSQISTKIIKHKAVLSSPINFGEIYTQANTVLEALILDSDHPEILLSPGTPAMQAVWILLGKTKYPSKFIQSSIEQGVNYVEIPFEIAAEYTPSIQSLSRNSIETIHQEPISANAAFGDIVTRNSKMLTTKKQAEILAGFDVPVLINGETGTGKELFARAIHNSSARHAKPFIAVNCGTLSAELIDSLLFGHKKGAFTGAHQDHLGFFREADEGTIFLDEFGELSSHAQVRLLRVIQEQVVTPVGSAQEFKVNVRVIAATHKNLMEMVANGTFREDLFYRVAIGLINIPPIREREGDLLLLAENILETIKSKEPRLGGKYFSVSARNIIINYDWPGNVRELQSTVMRAALWSSTDKIDSSDVQNAIILKPNVATEVGLKDISQGIDINMEISDMVTGYIRKSLAKTGNNKTKAAELLGLKNYQTLNNWIEKYNIEK